MKKVIRLLLFGTILIWFGMGPLLAQGKAGKKNVVTFDMLWEDFLKGYRSLESTITLRATMGSGDRQAVHIDELYTDWVSINTMRPISMDSALWNFYVGYGFRPFRPVSVNLGLDFRPLQYSRLYNGFNEYANWSVNTSWDIGSDLNIAVNLSDQNGWNYGAARNVYGRLLSVVRSEADANDATGSVTYRKYSRAFIELKPLKTLQPLEPKFSVEVTTANVSFPMVALDPNEIRYTQYNESLNLLTMSGSLTLRLDQYTAAVSYSQTPNNNTINTAGTIQNYLQQNWSTYIEFRLNRYTTFRTTLSYSRSLNRFDSIFRSHQWSSAYQELNEATKYFTAYQGENNANGTSLSFQVQMR